VTNFRVIRGEAGWTWKLIAGGGADLLAWGGQTRTDELQCRSDIRSVIARADSAVVGSCGGHHWQWQILDSDGTLLARSAEPFGNKRACTLALKRFQLQMRILRSACPSPRGPIDAVA
jgi:hypothetical protein